ncbi:MAG TPA: HAMP domain-containing sensor histidine kinase [Steroidobacteraceae bacterium]
MTSISRRLIFWLAIPLMLIALCGALVHYYNNVAPGILSSDSRLKDVANTLMARLAVKNDTVSFADGSDGRQFAAREGVRFAIRDDKGRLLAGESQVPAVHLDSDTSQIFSMAQIEDHNFRVLTTRFDSPAGLLSIAIAAPSARNPGARYGFMSTLLWDFVQLDVTLVLVWIGIHLGLRPVKRLRDEIGRRSPLDLRPIVETTVPREIAPVVVTLNRLFAALRGAAQSQQQFIANTAHQLRTPITGMQAQLEALVAEPAAQPVQERLRTLQEGIRQLAHASNQLLTLARADPTANLAAKTQQVDLGALVGDIAARYFDRALRSNIDLGIEAAPASISADPSLLDDLVSNLVDNALKYTPAGGRVTVSVVSTDGKPAITVEDSGPGIPLEERQRVRQRFYRLPNSPGHGSGLGLAIVDEIARLYGGGMAIDAGAGGKGTRVTIQFP